MMKIDHYMKLFQIRMMFLFERIELENSMCTLTEDEKNIIMSRYYEDLTQCEVARKLSMSQVMVSRYEKKGIEKMRNYLSL